MKIDGSMMKTVAAQPESKKDSVKKKSSGEIERDSNILKNDIRNVNTSSLKEVKFQSFDEAMKGLKSIKKALHDNPNAVQELHGELNTENTQYLLRDE